MAEIALLQSVYYEYVGLKPLKLRPWDPMFLTEDGEMTNIPQGKQIGNLLGYEPMEYQKRLFNKYASIQEQDTLF